jgi:hypothetical protein
MFFEGSMVMVSQSISLWELDFRRCDLSARSGAHPEFGDQMIDAGRDREVSATYRETG